MMKAWPQSVVEMWSWSSSNYIRMLWSKYANNEKIKITSSSGIDQTTYSSFLKAFIKSRALKPQNWMNAGGTYLRKYGNSIIYR